MKRYLRYWYKATTISFLSSLSNRLSVFIFILAKTVRVLSFFIFLSFLMSNTQNLAGYDRAQVIFFFLNFYFLDTLSQLFLRGVYFFREKVVSGNFDYVLTRPLNVLFNVLGSHADVQDLFVAGALLATLIFFLAKNNQLFSFSGLGLYLLLFANGFTIAVAFHILLAAVILVSLDVDHAILVYRDLSSLMRLPIEVYREPVRFLITFALPLGVMTAFPVKALFGLLSPSLVFISFGISFFFFLISVSVWNRALNSYASASS